MQQEAILDPSIDFSSDFSARKRLRISEPLEQVSASTLKNTDKTTKFSAIKESTQSPHAEDSIVETLDNKNHLFSHAEESGTVSIKSITSVGLVFENAPVWILGLFPIKVDKIYIPQFLSFSDLLRHIESKGIDSQLYNKYVSLVGRKCLFLEKIRCRWHIGLFRGQHNF